MHIWLILLAILRSQRLAFIVLIKTTKNLRSRHDQFHRLHSQNTHHHSVKAIVIVMNSPQEQKLIGRNEKRCAFIVSKSKKHFLGSSYCFSVDWLHFLFVRFEYFSIFGMPCNIPKTSMFQSHLFPSSFTLKIGWCCRNSRTESCDYHKFFFLHNGMMNVQFVALVSLSLSLSLSHIMNYFVDELYSHKIFLSWKYSLHWFFSHYSLFCCCSYLWLFQIL